MGRAIRLRSVVDRSRRRFLLAASCLVPLGAAWACRGRRSASARPHVLLVTLDTTRRDRLGPYRRPNTSKSASISPNLDALAAQSIVYTRAVAASSWTLPSHASLFTGKFPTSHGVRYDPEGTLRLTAAIEGPGDWDAYRVNPLAPDEATLASTLREAGYRTGAVVAGPWMKRAFGLDGGFDHYDDDEIGDVNGRLASSVTAAALRFLEELEEEPAFLFLNYFDPHGPYDAPAPFGGRDDDAPAARYDGEVRYMDHHVGRLLDGLRRLGLYDDCLIVVTADHGELLGEHGKMGHGASLFEEEVRVPFLVKYPRGEKPAGTTDEPVHHVDVLPLVLERVGIAAPAGIQGAPRGVAKRPLIAEVYPLAFMSTEGGWRALYVGDKKFLWNSRGRHALYDLAADPGEQTSLFDAREESARRLVTLAERLWSSLPAPGGTGPPAVLDEETANALRSLGYVP